MIALPAMWLSKLDDSAHHRPPRRRTNIEKRKTGRLPITIAIGMENRFPTPMRSVG
jgi:hypothetical protein